MLFINAYTVTWGATGSGVCLHPHNLLLVMRGVKFIQTTLHLKEIVAVLSHRIMLLMSLLKYKFPFKMVK